jgi:conserved domain protein
LNDTVNICNDIVKRIIQDKVKAVNEKYGVKKRWRASSGEDYFYIDDYCWISRDTDWGYNEDNARYDFGNYFETEEEAEKYLEYMKKCSLEWDEREEG